MVFPVVMYGCESWTVKKAERWRIDAFELWCWRRLLTVPWTARRSNQSVLKEISPGCSLEGMMLKLKLQYSGHLIWRIHSLEKTLKLGGIEGRKRKGWQRMRWTGWHLQLEGREFEWTPGVGMDREAWRAAIHGIAKSWTRLSGWTELKKIIVVNNKIEQLCCNKSFVNVAFLSPSFSLSLSKYLMVCWTDRWFTP